MSVQTWIYYTIVCKPLIEDLEQNNSLLSSFISKAQLQVGSKFLKTSNCKLLHVAVFFYNEDLNVTVDC